MRKSNQTTRGESSKTFRFLEANISRNARKWRVIFWKNLVR
ncbi:hypothetical protein [Hydrocoleum sp. CS-953]|nr:hypothetical protein [Hydrocoleum sp. CS-953]